MECGAKKRRSGEPCRAKAMQNGRCRIHGGKSLAGIASPTFKTGRYSKVIPTQLAGNYEQALADPDLLGIKQDIALQDSLILNALEGMSRGESGELWANLHATWRLYLKAKGDPSKDENELLAMIGFLIKEGYTEQQTRNEVRGLLQERSRLVDTEGKRLERAQQTLNTNQAMSLAQALLQAVLENVSDPITRNNIQGRFVQLINRPDY